MEWVCLLAATVSKKWKICAKNICVSVSSSFNQGIYKNWTEKITLLLFYLANEDIQQKTKWEKFPFEKSFWKKIDTCLFRQTKMDSTNCDSQFTLKEKCIFVYAIVRITDKFMLLLVSSYIMFLIDVCYYISSFFR